MNFILFLGIEINASALPVEALMRGHGGVMLVWLMGLYN